MSLHLTCVFLGHILSETHSIHFRFLSEINPTSYRFLVQMPPETMAEDQNEALLKLKILNGEGLKDIRLLGKMKTCLLVWIDPRFKQSTKTLTSSTKSPTWNYDLSFPLSLQTLQNPNARITIQIVSPSSPIHSQRVIGSTIMSISDIRFEEQVFTLQLWRPSGRAHGLIRVSARVDIDLGFYTPVGCVTGIPVEMDSVQSPPLIFDQVESRRYHNVAPSAPFENHSVETTEDGDSSVPVEINSLQLPQLDHDRKDEAVSDCNSLSSCNLESPAPTGGSNVLRSFFIGVLGGAVAVATVLVGSTNS